MRLRVIGTGYVGLVTSACFADLGHDVIGVDRGGDGIATLEAGKTPFYEPGLDVMRRPVLIDGRNILDPGAMRALGFHYSGIGR